MTEPARDPATKDEELLQKRVESLMSIWDELKANFPDDFAGCYLDVELLREVVENYLVDRRAYMERCKIKPPSKIKLHKIAGLLASSVCKFRPVQFVEGTGPHSHVMQNELLAFWHGIFVCSEPYKPHSGELALSLTKCEFFPHFQQEVLSLFHRRCDSADAFISLFHAICIHYFPLAISNTGGDRV
jgi:hypothetical protein